MTKKHILFFGTAFAVAGYFSFSAFGPKQDAQKAEIASAVTAKLDELRASKEQECTAKVMTEAQKRYDEAMAAVPAVAAPVAAPAKKTIVTKKGSKGPKVDPLPQTTAPSSTKPASQGKWDQGGQPSESQKKWEQGAPADKSGTPAAPQESRKKWEKAGGGGR